MAENSASTWALVIRDDGEASVVPLAEVPTLQPAEESGCTSDENPTFIVLHAQDEGAGGMAGNTEGVVSSSGVGKASTDNLTDFISLSGGQEEGTVSHLGSAVITIADASQQLSAIDPGALETLPISVLAQKDTTRSSHGTETRGTVHVPSTLIQVPASHSQPTLHLPQPVPSSTVVQPQLPPDTDTRNKEKQLRNRDVVDFSWNVERWTEKLASSCDVIEPFEHVEASLPRDLTSQLGLTPDSGIWVNLRGSGGREGVRVREVNQGQVVISGSLAELLASRDMILMEIQKIRGLPPPPDINQTKTGCREVGVTCNIIPSPPPIVHPIVPTSDSTHSVPSRPHEESTASSLHLSLRRRSTRLLSPSQNTKNRGSGNRRGRTRGIGERKQNKHVKKGDWGNVKLEGEIEESESVQISTELQDSSENVELSLTDLKTEISCEGTVVVASLCEEQNITVSKKDNMSEIKTITPRLVPQKDHKNLSFSSLVEDMEIKPFKPIEKREYHEETELQVYSLNQEVKTDMSKKITPTKRTRLKEKYVDYDGEDYDVEEKMVTEVEEGHDEEEERGSREQEAEMKFKFSCKICSYKSMRENHFLKHMQLHDKGLALYRCEECSFVSIRASHLRRHKMSHAQLVLRCHLCPYTCDDDHKLMAKHVRVRHHTQPRKHPRPSGSVYECNECDYKTTWQYAFQRHRRTHASSKMVATHSCPQCSYKTVRREHFLRHIKNVHQNCRPFLCDICGKAFKRQDALKQHHVSHYQTMGSGGLAGNGGQAGPYGFVCHVCQKVCRSAAYLKEHMATHSEERAFLCEVCGASFKTRSVQRNHVQTIHRRPRAFTCPTCDRRFNTNFALRRHMKAHDSNLGEVDGLSKSSTSRITSNNRLCNLPPCSPPLTHTTNSSLLHPDSGVNKGHHSSPPSPQPHHQHHTPSAYHITIDGEPAFILPDLITSEHNTNLPERGTAISDGNGTVLVGGDSGRVGNLTSSLDSHNSHRSGESGRGNMVADGRGGNSHVTCNLPVPSTTVHILNQDGLQTSGPGELILTGKGYESGDRPVNTNTSNTDATSTAAPSYLTQDHTTPTLLYLTTNFN